MRKLYFTLKMIPRQAVCLATFWVLISGILPALGAEGVPADQAYQDYVKLEACIVAQIGVRTYLEGQARVSFDSCASKKFDVAISTDDRDYNVSGFATVLPPSGPPALKPFSVRIIHNPGQYPEWNFRVSSVDVGR